MTDDATNWIITCTVANAQITDINEAWSLTKDDGNLTLKVVSDNQVDAAEEELMPDMDLGSLSFTATFPGPIASITGNGATKVNDNTFTIDGSLNDSFDVTVVAASEPSGSTMKLLILVILAIAVLAVFVVAIVLLVKGKKKDEPSEIAAQEPPTADSSDPSI